MEAIFSSPLNCPEIQPISKKTNDVMTVACFFKNGSFFSSNRSFSGITLRFSKAPAFSSCSMDAFPYNTSLEAPKLTLASETPSRCFTFFSNVVAQPDQLNPCMRYTCFSADCSIALSMNFPLLFMSKG